MSVNSSLDRFPLPSRPDSHLPPPSLFFFFFPSFPCSHLANSASTPVIFYCVEVISTLSAKWKHMMCAGFGLNGVGLAWSSTDTQPHRRAAAKTASPWNASCPLLHWRCLSFEGVASVVLPLCLRYCLLVQRPWSPKFTRTWR